jgi:heat shock protein HslJ
MSNGGRIRSVLAAALLVAGLAGGASAQSAAPGGLAGTSWLLGEVGGTPVASGTPADILFTDTEVSGSAGCNRFFGSYTTDGSATLTFGPLATTMMSCGEATDAFEQGYLAALGTVATYAIDGDALTLSDASGTAVLAYSRSAPASVEGPWIATGWNNGNEGVVSPMTDDTAPSLSFHPDGTVDGNGGCNSFSGGYSIHDDAIAIGPLMGTLMSCGDELDTQQAQFTAALEAATTWSITSGSLELRDDSGALQASFRSALGN